MVAINNNIAVFSVLFASCWWTSLFPVVRGVNREDGCEGSRLDKKYGRGYYQEEANRVKIPKRYYVKTKGKRNKIKGDAEGLGGRLVHDFDALGLAVVSFDDDSTASKFKRLGHLEAMEEDAPRYLMGAVESSIEDSISSASDNNNETITMHAERPKNHHLRQLQTQAIPDGLFKIFGGTMPAQSYYPASKTPINSICIIDSGFAGLNHPDLQGVFATAADPSQSNNYWDTCDHGTHVAGTIVAENNNVGVLGVFPGASILVVKVFNWNGSKCAWTYSSSLVAAANYCANRGAKIISMSLGGNVSVASERIALASLRSRGILIIAAAGNNGSMEYNYPASYSSVISVGAVDKNNNKADFSQWNDMVDIAAPGVAVLSTVPYGQYKYMSGTSMATPHVSGVAFLLWNKYPRCTADQIQAALLSTSLDLGKQGKDVYFGVGLVQYWAAAGYLMTAKCG
jgi:subtilisin family serine protease